MNEKDVDLVLHKSEEICKELNFVLGKELAGLKEMQMGVAYYSVARFAAQFLHDVMPALGDDIPNSFQATVNDILQAFQNEGPDDTYRFLKFMAAEEN